MNCYLGESKLSLINGQSGDHEEDYSSHYEMTINHVCQEAEEEAVEEEEEEED